MKNRIKRVAALALACVAVAASCARGQERHDATYANPMALGYRFQLDTPSRREAADPTMVVFRGEYWLFASKSGGYWHSHDLRNWTYVRPSGLPLEDYAPTAVVIGKRIYFTAFNSKGIWSTDDPAAGVWTKDATIDGYADPDLFLDDDGRLYLYAGCSNKTPLTVTELDWRHGFRVVRSAAIEASRDPEHRGFEVPGEENELTGKAPWIEGAWMTKYGGRYYLQYAAPGTQFNSYADPVLVGDGPMGPFHAPAWSPLTMKPRGFIAGAGHGSTFRDLEGRWWHIATMSISVRHPFERRLGLFPVRFLPDGQMTADTYLADYPHRWEGDRGLAGWMLLSHNKPVRASSTLTGHEPEKAVAENVRAWWSATSGNAGEWFVVDLKTAATIHAVQIDFADEGSQALGVVGEGYRYLLEASRDGKTWQTLVDRRAQASTSSSSYEELTHPVGARYVRITNAAMPAGARFSLSGFRVFGVGRDARPAEVQGVTAARSTTAPQDERIAELAWRPAQNAEFYVVRYGIAPDRLSASYQVYDATSLEIRSLMGGTRYWFSVDAVNAAGVTRGHRVIALAAHTAQ